MPDKSANGLFSWAKNKGMEWGTIGTIPEIPGLGLAASGHVGVYIGNGQAAQAMGFDYGCRITQVKRRSWQYWFKIPGLDYSKQPTDRAHFMPVVEAKLGDKALKKGDTGNDVRALQENLNHVINAGLEVDGDFGSKTEAAVKLFQAKAEITVDGVYGAQAHEALMSMLADDTDCETIKEPDLLPSQAKANGKVYSGDGTQYTILTTLNNDIVNLVLNKNNKALETMNGWIAIECAHQIGWIQAKDLRGVNL